MKKKIIVLIVTIVAAICGVFGYSHYNNKGMPFINNYDVEYYGCPNSNRIKKLNTEKRKRK